MRERPILFSGPMVRAILAGAKTQTRRPVKPQPPPEATEAFAWYEPDFPADRKAEEGCYYRHTGGLFFLRACPYGAPGDRLWVRETWTSRCWDGVAGRVERVAYAAGGEQRDLVPAIGWERPQAALRGEGWTPGIHMPRWACRLVLDITAVGVERLSRIVPCDAEKEGVGTVEAFLAKWDTLYAGGPFAVERDPWVWVVQFRRAVSSSPADGGGAAGSEGGGTR